MRKVLMCFFVLPLAMVSVQGQEIRLENVEEQNDSGLHPTLTDDVFGAGARLRYSIEITTGPHRGHTNDDKVLMIRR